MIRWSLFLLLSMAGCAQSTASRPAGPGTVDAEGRVVELVIDYGDGSERKFTNIPWYDGITVADALQAASERPRGIKIESLGRGEGEMLMQIDGVDNGSGDPKGYWTFSVQGNDADRSMRVYELKPGDMVKWTFGPYNQAAEASDQSSEAAGKTVN